MQDIKNNSESTFDSVFADKNTISIDRKKFFISTVVVILVALIIVATSVLSNPDRLSEQASKQESIVTSPEEDAKNREQLKQLLSKFDNNLQPSLDIQDLYTWRTQEVENILQLKESAITNFAKGMYLTAISEIEDASKNTEDLIKGWKLAYEEQLNEALFGFEQGKLNIAEIELNKAFEINSIDQRGHELKEKIASAPLIAELFEQLNVAYTENDFDKTIVIYQSILQLSPEREDVKEALNKAVYQQQTALFQSHIQKGMALIEQGELIKADEQYELAKHIFPNRIELQSLAEKLNDIESDQVLDAIHKKIEQGIQRDDWQYLAKLTSEAIVEYPSDPLINEYKKLSSKVLQLLDVGTVYTYQLERMSDLTIQEEVKSYIKEALGASRNSQSLQQLVLEISKNLKKYSAKHDVVLKSDGKTHIIVMGEGVVGKTKSKTIQLPIGTYVLEGSRKGYRSKQISVVVDGKTKINVTLECDERIR